eukprot:CAMPEP_0204037974 /NCGR_PEP_ID=MMETSP0360-20130528/85404_1 /ASSEMBLY_ACC=CAM_ASM_000342 /TAXON_ID=268821 /ORGANISM="Scrippsiella Hangoei, Strain SHTV-5" /LENGTH=37 /DNA_ID= /DNA_START= /DNA_END= /DNA_ORIENTATION=
MVLLLHPNKAHEFLGVHPCMRTAEGRVWILHVEADAL